VARAFVHAGGNVGTDGTFTGFSSSLMSLPENGKRPVCPHVSPTFIPGRESGTDRNPTVYPGSYVEYVEKLGHEVPGIYS
jgi:hypothetical protein